MKSIFWLFLPFAALAQPNPTVATYLSNTLGNQFAAVRSGIVGRSVPKLPLVCANHFLMGYSGEGQLNSIASGSRIAAINAYTDSLIASGFNCIELNQDLALAMNDPNSFMTLYDSGLQHMLALGTPPTIIFRSTISAAFQATACAYNGASWCSSGSSFTGGTPAGYSGLSGALNQALNLYLQRTINASTWGASMSGGISVMHEAGILIPANTGITGATAAQNQTLIDSEITTTILLSCCTAQHFFATVVSSGAEEVQLGALLAQDANISAVGIDFYYPGNCTYPCATGTGGADTSAIAAWLGGVAGASGPVGSSNFYSKPWYPDEVGPINLEYTGIGVSPPPGESNAIWGYGSPFNAFYSLDVEWYRTIFMWTSAHGCCQSYSGPMLYASPKVMQYTNAPACPYLTSAPSCGSAAACQCTADNLSLPTSGSSIYGNAVAASVVTSVGTYNLTSPLANLFKKLSTYGFGGVN